MVARHEDLPETSAIVREIQDTPDFFNEVFTTADATRNNSDVGSSKR